MAKEKCGAKRTGGGTCGHVAGFGTNHLGAGRCKFHGGATPSGEKAGAEELARKGILWYGDPVDQEPGEALLEEVRRTAGHVRWLEKKIADWTPEATKGETGETLDVTNEMRRYQQLYQVEREHLVQVCKVAVAAGVEQRQIDLAERMGDKLAELIDGILADLDLSKAQWGKVPDAVRTHLSAMERKPVG